MWLLVTFSVGIIVTTFPLTGFMGRLRERIPFLWSSSSQNSWPKLQPSTSELSPHDLPLALTAPLHCRQHTWHINPCVLMKLCNAFLPAPLYGELNSDWKCDKWPLQMTFVIIFNIIIIFNKNKNNYLWIVYELFWPFLSNAWDNTEVTGNYWGVECCSASNDLFLLANLEIGITIVPSIKSQNNFSNLLLDNCRK